MKRKALTAAALVFTLTLTGCPAPDDEVQTVTCLVEENTSAWSETIENNSDFVPGAEGAETSADVSGTNAETHDSFQGVEETTPDPKISEDPVIAEDDIPDALKHLASSSGGQSSENPGSCFEAAFLKYAAAEGENAVISPASAKLAMSMAAMGAGEDSSTETELLGLFGYESRDEMSRICKTLMEELNREDGSLSAKNSMWVSDRVKSLNSSFSDGLKNYFFAESFTRDLTSQGFVDELNGWVETNTDGLIKEMLDEPMSEEARLALVNTLYFKNEWSKHFNDRYPRGFYGVSGFNENAPAMSMTEHIMYSADGTFKSVKLDYTDGSCMKIFLPADENKFVTDIIAEMSAEELAAAMEPFYSSTYVSLTMPPFECDYKASLVEMFQSLGVKDCFDGSKADFSGITSDVPLVISDVIQAAKIICGEDGTEAAAATIVIMAECAFAEPSEPVELIIDRPFLYSIEAPSGETIFMGVITDIQ